VPQSDAHKRVVQALLVLPYRREGAPELSVVERVLRRGDGEQVLEPAQYSQALDNKK